MWSITFFNPLTLIHLVELMALALFDLDNTLLNGDSDYSWGLFLADIGVVDAAEQQDQQDYFYEQYSQGVLDMHEYLQFQLKPLTENDNETLYGWRNDYVRTVITPMLESGQAHLLEPHREAGDDLVIITATSDFIARPIADKLGVRNLIATTAEIIAGKYTGRTNDTPCFQEGKITRLNKWLAEQGKVLSDSYFYSDSINDLPLLELVDVPIAVTPDDKLRAHAMRLNWKIID